MRDRPALGKHAQPPARPPERPLIQGKPGDLHRQQKPKGGCADHPGRTQPKGPLGAKHQDREDQKRDPANALRAKPKRKPLLLPVAQLLNMSIWHRRLQKSFQSSVFELSLLAASPPTAIAQTLPAK